MRSFVAILILVALCLVCVAANEDTASLLEDKKRRVNEKLENLVKEAAPVKDETTMQAMMRQVINDIAVDNSGLVRKFTPEEIQRHHEKVRARRERQRRLRIEEKAAEDLARNMATSLNLL